MTQRIEKIYSVLKKRNLDCLIVSSAPNITYLTGYPSRDSCFLVSRKGSIYFTDSRYTQEAKKCLKGAVVVEKINGSIFELILRACRKFDFKLVGFEERSVSYLFFRKIKECLGDKIELVPTSNLIEELRQVKTEEELERIKTAVKIAVSAVEFIKDFIKAGRKEIEVAAELERFIRYNGSGGCAFETIVASGPNSSFPHHITSQRMIQNNEPVLIDIGVDCEGYKSDLTRVFFLGKINTLYEKVYSIVLKAQDKAIRQIKLSESINRIDSVARQFIVQSGYGRFFGHALGHGVGLEVHEAPRISGKENSVVKAGMVFTIEPGIYLPGKFGVRIEDMVLVTRKGSEVLSVSLDK